MRAFHVCAGLALIVALGYVGVSWAVAGVGLCLFVAIALALVCRSSTPMRCRPCMGLSHQTSRQRCLQNDRRAIIAVGKGPVGGNRQPGD
jgi:hypothetical protein